MDSIWHHAARLETPAISATLVRVTGSAPREAGAKMLIGPAGLLEGTLGGGRLELQVLAEARAMLEGCTPQAHRTYRLNPAEDQCCGGEVDVFFERIAPHPQVVLLGAGHVSQAVARALEPLPFHVTVVDERPEFATRERYPGTARVQAGNPIEILGTIPTSADNSYALIFTHSHRQDLALLTLLVARPLRYLGLIGSRTKWARFRAALLSRGVSEAQLARVHCPIGIGVGGKAAAEIAVSVVAQLLAVRDGVTIVAHTAAGLATSAPAAHTTDPARAER
jgi:xanthine dehydrogenase accessory factor